MKRILLSVVIAVVAIASAFAQDALVATLQHGENTVTAFYGASALEKAHDAAQSGDIITLSAGAFNAVEITKAVKIYGAGYEMDAEHNRYRTTLQGITYIKLPSSESGFFMEGIYSNDYVYVRDTLRQATFSRCRFSYLDFSDYRTKSINCMIDRCRISGNLDSGNTENMLVRNSLLCNVYNNGEESTMLVSNCVIAGAGAIAQYRNCIMNYPNTNAGCSYYNCVYSTYYGKPNGNVSCAYTSEKWGLNEDLHLFTDTEMQQIMYDDNCNYVLNEQAAAKYIGTDGTQVGIYGGATPFTSVTSLPQIVSKQIATETSTDGKLSVKITVEAQ